MKFFILSIILFFSINSFSDITGVSTGDTITALKTNEIISEVNTQTKYQQSILTKYTEQSPGNITLLATEYSSKSTGSPIDEFFSYNAATGIFTVNKKGQFDLTMIGRHPNHAVLFVIKFLGTDRAAVKSNGPGDEWITVSQSWIFEAGDTFSFYSYNPVNAMRIFVVAKNL